MASDTNRILPAIEMPSAGPYSGFPGYENFRVGDPIPEMPGSVVGGDIVNDAGDRWNWVKGEWETAAKPQEPSSPFEKFLVDLEKLQPPVAFTPQSEIPYQGAGQYFAAPTPPSLIRPAFGPVTASGYTQPPVDPLSYYSTPEPTPEPTPYTGGPTRWFYFKTPTPDLNIPQSTAQPEQPSPNLSNPQTLNQEQLNPVAQQLGTSATTIMDPITGLPIEVIANPDFVEPRVLPNPPRLGLPEIPPGMLDPVMDYDQWKYVDRYIRKPDKPTTPTEDENVKELTPEEVEQLIGGQTPTPPVPPQEDVPRLAPEAPSTPGLPTIVRPKPVVSIPKPNLDLPEPPKNTTPVRNLGRVIPFNMPTEVPIPPRRTVERLAPGYFQDINYDPDEILAAAMRIMGGRQARRSILSELQ